jgi:hypothetical protein
MNQTHVFTLSGKNYGTNPTDLMKQDDKEAVIRSDSLLPTSRNRKAKKLLPEEHQVALAKMEEELEVLVPTPLRPIKQVELHTKWGPLLPAWAAAITCPKPSDSVINQIKEEKREKARGKKKAKLSQPTSTAIQVNTETKNEKGDTNKSPPNSDI